MFIQITQVWAHYFKLFDRVESAQDEKAGFIKINELKLTQVELFSFLLLKREYARGNYAEQMDYFFFFGEGGISLLSWTYGAIGTVRKLVAYFVN